MNSNVNNLLMHLHASTVCGQKVKQTIFIQFIEYSYSVMAVRQF